MWCVFIGGVPDLPIRQNFSIIRYIMMTKIFKFPAAVAFVLLAAWTAGAAAREVNYETAPREAGEPIMAVVSIESQNVTFYDAKGWILRAPVSTGTHGRETPAGIFAVIEKNREHRSNMYDDAKMPNMQRITWNGIALHGGPLPGYAASHGCVRMPYGFARSVFNKTRIGMRVIISPHDAVPLEFSHPTLFSPDVEVVAAAPARAVRLKQEAADAVKGYKEARKTARSTARKVVLQKRSLRRLEQRKRRADSSLKRADKALAAADKVKARAYDRLLTATAEATEAATQLNAAKSELQEKVAAAATAVATAKDATQKNDAAKQAEKSAERAVALQKEALAKLETLKQSADAERKLADKALSAADAAKLQAEERLRKATAENAELTTQIETAESELPAKLAAAEAAAKALDAAIQKSDAAKQVSSGAARLVESRQATLDELKSRKETAAAELTRSDKELSVTDKAKANAEITKLATQIASLESDLKTRVVNADVVAKMADDAAQKSDAVKQVERGMAHEAALHRETIAKLKALKQSAEAELKLADEALSAADAAKLQAEERLRKAKAESAELASQIEKSASDLKSKLAAAESATAATNDATQARDAAKQVEKSAAQAVKLSKAAVRKLESHRKRLDTQLKRADNKFSAAGKSKLRAEEKLRKASAEAKDMADQVASAKSELQAMIAAAATAKEGVTTAKIRKAESAQAAVEAKLALEPVSVYISRATQKLYVRRNTHKPARDGGGEEFDSSIEVPVSITDPDTPIGTHIFTAMEQNDAGLRWSVVTIDNGDDAQRALDRVTIPQEVLERIAPTALPRSSIIISDEPLSRETNYRTEFVTVLSNQPQGGFITRKRTQVSVPDAEDDAADENAGDAEQSGYVSRTPRFLGF